MVFPKNLLLTSNITSVTAYLTARQRPPARDCSGCTPGLLSSRSGDWTVQAAWAGLNAALSLALCPQPSAASS